MRRLALALALLCALCASCSGASPFAVGRASPARRAHEMLAKMNQTEKLAMVHGNATHYAGMVVGNSRLNIPHLTLQDGPQGVGDGVTNVTCWPSALTVVATWDTLLMKAFASAMAVEQRGKGTNILLGPMVNIARVPMGGRNFESFGEDPYLASRMVEANVQGIQSQGVMATVKHFVDNNQELNRTLVSENVPQRAQWEIYYPAFQAAVDAGVGAVMCSYNRINDTYACENEQTLSTDLKGRMGFQGFVMSDWGATHSTVKAANAGLDMQMPDDAYFGPALAQAVANGSVPQSRLDDMVLRILTSMYAAGIFDEPVQGNLTADVRSRQHTQLALDLAVQANVLLKNDRGVLPLDPLALSSVAIIGDDANATLTATGDGSGHVIPPYVASPLDGVRAFLQSAGSRANVSYSRSSPIGDAASAAAAADVAIVFVANTSGEGHDREGLSMGPGQDALVAAVAAAQPYTVVVAHLPGAVLMPWADAVPAIIAAFLPGQVDGDAIAPVLFGAANPSARLPVTFPRTQDQIPVNTTRQYPGYDNEAYYSEDLLVGYRWYDALDIGPLFPFGHGLSYTTFNYSGLHIFGSSSHHDGVTVAVHVKNAGAMAGAEIVQLYVGFPPSAGEPPKSLRGFQKINLNPGDSTKVSFRLKKGDLSIWDTSRYDWVLPTGTFTAYVGASSRDIRLQGTFQ